MAAENKNSTPCTCAGMQLFSAPINPSDLQKSAAVALPKNLPSEPAEITKQISGVRDDSLKNAQTAIVSTSLTHQKLDNLPEVVKSQSSVMAVSEQLSAAQTSLITQTAQVHTLGTQLTAIEETRSALQPNHPDLPTLDAQHIALQAEYDSARSELDHLSQATQEQLPGISQQIDDLKAQYDSTQMPALSPPSFPSLSTVTSAFVLPDIPAIPEIPTIPALPTAMPTLSGLPAMPELPASPITPQMPAIPELPAFSAPVMRDAIEWVKLPAGLFPTPELPAMPEFPGSPDLPEIPATLLDDSVNSALTSADAAVLEQAQAYSISEIKLSDVAAYLPKKVTETIESMKSALTATSTGYITDALSALPALSARPALPAFPATADLTPFAGMEIPTLPSLQANIDKFSPSEFTFFSAIWTEITAKQAAIQRSMDAAKEATANFHTSISNVVDAQINADLEGMPLQQYLDKTSEENPIYIALAEQQNSFFAKKFPSPETPTVCAQTCQNAGIRYLFPDVSSPAQMEVAAFFADQTLVSTPAVHVVSVGTSEDAFVKGHIANLETRVQSAGGKTTTLFAEDIDNATTNPADMLKLEAKLKDTSLVTIPDVQNLSPQSSALVSDISKKMSATVPVIITTPSIGSLSTDPTINTAMIQKLAPGGSAVDARKPAEIPNTTVYSKVHAQSDTHEESAFSKIFKKFTAR